MLAFAILGPLEVRTDDRLVAIGGFRQKALLAMLLLHANEVVSSDRLIVELWGAETSVDKAALRVRISQLRKLLRSAGGDEVIDTRAPGYVVRLDADQLDLARHERLVESADRALPDDPWHAAASLRQALGLWRGPPLADFTYQPFAQTAVGRLDELRLATLEKRIEAELALGLERELVGELRALVAEHPLRERFRGQLMLALYRAGRQAEALDLYQQTRELLVEELGIEPGPALQGLQRAVLAQEASLERGPLPTARGVTTPPATAAPHPSRRETRKMVTILFCDVVESTSPGERFDAEVMLRVMESCFETSAEILRRHGGMVEKFMGDSVLAVFGVPTAHEDDALRAVRAAVELRAALTLLNDERAAESKIRLSTRFGIETGEVVASDDNAGQAFVTGEAVSTAAQLHQVSDPDEILIGESTWRLVRGAVGAEFADVVKLKRKNREVAAWRLLDVDRHATALPRRIDTPFVGRATELAQLRSAFERTCRELVPCLFTVFGEAGIGKSRLAEEARFELLAEARVLVGRCPPYGEGVTFAPLREIVRQALGDNATAALRVVLAEEPDGGQVAATVSALLGLAPSSIALEEGFWGVRRLCETLAQPRPLVLVFEDIHWAESTMLDLIEFVADNARESPILLLCLTRHELLDHRPAWGGGKLNATAVALGPLPDAESGRLADWLIRDLRASSETRAQVIESARGNPLFVEQLVAMLADRGLRIDEPSLPATIESLIAARLELLGPAERMMLEYGAVLGDRFESSALARLVAPDLLATLSQHLQALVRKELLRPTRLGEGGAGHRFRHVLVRQAAYRRLSKVERAELHERYADWLEASPRDVPAGGGNELLGYHLEQAHGYRLQLGREDAHSRRLAERAATHLAAAAGEAFARADFRAVDQLIARTTALIATDDPRRPGLLYDRGTSLFTLGRQDEADALLCEAIEAAQRIGDAQSEWRASIDRALFRIYGRCGIGLRDGARLARNARSALDRLDDDRGLARAWLLVGAIEAQRGRAARMERAAEQVLRHARKSGVYREEAWALWWLAEAILIGPTPVAVGTAHCEELLRGRDELRVGDVGVFGTLVLLRAMEGEFDRGRQLLAEGRELMERLGHGNPLLATMYWRAQLELLADEPEAAEFSLREAQEAAASSGNAQTTGEVAMLRARVALAQGRPDEAEQLAHLARDAAAPESRPAQASWRSVLAAALAQHGQTDTAVTLATEALRLLRATDLLTLRAEVWMDVATALAAHADAAGAARANEQAVALYEQKGNLVACRRARAASAPLSGRV
jgi:DNA-binding SARP family transcriptional activator